MAARRWAAKAEAEAAAVLEEASVEGVPVELLAEAANPPPRLRATPIPATPTLSPTSEPGRPRSVVVERILPYHTHTLTATPTPTAPGGPGSGPTATPTATPTVTPTPTATAVPVDIIDIESVNKTAETITIRNRGASAVDMALWVLVSQNGDEWFVFPPDNNWQRVARW
ncbi:MAG TPA: hypothetical protein QGH28_02250 [Chloroflexota bacterium]|nr:hypothetical protein [Chloroflexota bacterium]